MKNIQFKPLAAALITATLIVFITVILPFFCKTWFVYETGSFKILPAFGPVLALGIALRWPVRKLSLVLFAGGLAFSILGLWQAEATFQAGYSLLVALHVLLLCFLMSDSMKEYESFNNVSFTPHPSQGRAADCS